MNTKLLPLQSVNKTSSALAVDKPCWVVGLVITPAADDGSVVLKDGGSSGTAKLTINTKGHAYPNTFAVPIPSGYIEFGTNCYTTLSNAGVTLLYYQGT